MTPTEKEWQYRYDERLGILGVGPVDIPTPEQDEMAAAEADRAVEFLHKQEP